MRRLILTLALLLVSLPTTALAQDATPGSTPTIGQRTLTGTVLVTGRDLVEKLDDATCRVTLAQYEDEPGVTVSTIQGDVLGRGAFEIGRWSPASEGRDRANCEVDYEVSVSVQEKYLLSVGPFYHFTIRDAVAMEPFDFQVILEADDPFPPRPTVAAGANTDGTYHLVGTLEVLGTDYEDFVVAPLPEIGCVTGAGYEDIKAGARVSITNESGAIIAIATLAPYDVSSGRCLFQFEADVPEAPFYTISLGRRGDLPFAFAELEAAHWHVELTLGS